MRLVKLLLLLSFFVTSILSAADWRAEFYAFQNGLDFGSYEDEAKILKRLGYDGVAQVKSGGKDLEKRMKVYSKYDLKIGSLYFHIKEKAISVDTLKPLSGTSATLELMVKEVNPTVIKALKETVDNAAGLGIRVALYPHHGCEIDTMESALKLIDEINHPNLGTAFNLPHFLRVEDVATIETVIKKAGSKIFSVSTCGANSKGTVWGDFIKRLDQGNFHQARLFKALKAINYDGIVALQCYRVEGDKEKNLEGSINSWKDIMIEVKGPQGDERQMALLAEGKKLYEGPGGCFACHQIDGKGLAGVVPSLESTPWVSSGKERLIAIGLFGIEGPIEVNGKHFNSSMPPQSMFNDEQMSAILTYVRNSFRNNRSEKLFEITVEEVAKVRAKGIPDHSVSTYIQEYPFSNSAAQRNGLSLLVTKDADLYKDKPTVYRTYMPGASPAAFAVALPEGQYYCWDAGESRLRYVWKKGGFIASKARHWSTNGKPVADFKGKPYYRAHNSLITTDQIQRVDKGDHWEPVYDTSKVEDFPLRFGSKGFQKPDYKGYRLVDGHPEFHYQSGGADIYELIKSTEDAQGIVRQFRIKGNSDKVQFNLKEQGSALIETSKGKFKEGVLKLSANEAKNFSIFIREK